ncbi:hypothetical protein KY285_005271 [Solanum tuberosum]|nr:hypothetical protein KY285_005271 [Solanum tuberosum]
MAAGYLQNKRKNRERGEGKGLVHLAPIHRSFELLTGAAARKMRKTKGVFGSGCLMVVFRRKWSVVGLFSEGGCWLCLELGGSLVVLGVSGGEQ